MFTAPSVTLPLQKRLRLTLRPFLTYGTVR